MKKINTQKAFYFFCLIFLAAGFASAKSFQPLRTYHHEHSHFHRKVASNTPPPGSCSSAFEKTVRAPKVQGSSHIYVDVKDLSFLSDPTSFQLQDVQLNVTFKGNLTQTLNFSLNGFKVSQAGGLQKNSLAPLLTKTRNGETIAQFKLHPMLLNGAEPFEHLLIRLKKNKGVLKISLLGRHPQILDASVSFKGLMFSNCTTTSTTTTTTTTITVPNASTTTTTLPTTSSTTSTSTTSTTTTSTTTTTTLPPEDLSKYQVSIDSTSPSNSPTNSTSLLIYFSSLNTDGSYWCSLDQAAFDKCQSPVSLANLSNGGHNFQVFAQTPAGTETAAASYSWTVDSVAPVVTITNTDTLPSISNQTAITFQFASTKSGTFKCSIDGSAASACTSPATFTVFKEGLHQFTVTAIDTVGNVSGSPAQYQWTLDLTPPTVFISSVDPVEDSSSRSDKIFVFAASETSYFECSVDHGTFTACESPLALTNLSEGNHWLEIRATDVAGNLSSTISSSWTTDYTPPVLSLGAVSPTQGLTNTNKFSVEFFSNEPGQTLCQWDAQAPALCTSPFTLNSVSDGNHQLTISAVDGVGLVSNPVTLSWTVDSTAPVLSFGKIQPSAETYLNSTSFSAIINASESTTLSATLNGVAIEPFSNPIVLNNLTEGSYVLEVAGVDAAGNSANVLTHSFVVDLTAPQISLSSSGSSLTNLDSRSLIFSANEDATYECSLDSAGFEACQSPKDYSGLADGEHRFTLRVTDLAGNSSLAEVVWTVDATAPKTLLNSNQVGNAITFSLGSDESNVTYTCSMDSQTFASCSSPVSYTNLAVGSHTFVVKAKDAAGNTDPVGAVWNFIVRSPIHTSITSSSPTASTVNSKSMTIYFTADQTASGFKCSLDGAALSACTSPVSYSGLADGAHNFLVKAIDVDGVMDTTGASKSWTIDSVAPVVTSTTTSTTTNSITVTWVTNEASTGKVTYGVGTVMNQATAETSSFTTSHSIQLTGLSSNTLYSIQVSGRDAAGNVYTGNVITVRTNR